MQIRMWMYDLAREQSPHLDHLRQIARLTLDSGYNALGLYLEHRFAYPSALWANGNKAVQPEDVRTLIGEFPELQIIPFVNLLGHFEGMLYTEQGKGFAETPFDGLQACPCIPEFSRLCETIIDDVLEVFSSPIVHLGGDETQQLGLCPKCLERVQASLMDGKAALYREHFEPLLKRVIEKGRRPAMWADMFAEHPSALGGLPKDTLLFDWQYFGGVEDSSRMLRERGFSVVACPTLQTYNASWFHLNESETNVDLHVCEANDLKLEGVCLTTWEMGLFGAYDTLFPAIRAVGKKLSGEPCAFEGEYEASLAGEWARLMGIELPRSAPTFAHGQLRSSARVRFLLMSDPFLAWRIHGQDLSGPQGDLALSILESALAAAPNEAYQGVTRFVRHLVEFVRIADRACSHYAEGDSERAIGVLSLARTQFDDLESIAKRTVVRIGGSLADAERCRIAKKHVETVIHRIRQYGDGSLGYLPSFEHITHLRFVPHDQGAWWRINKWADS